MPTTNPLSTFIGADVTTVTVSGTAAETAIFTITIPGGTLGTQNGVRVTIYGTYVKNAAGSMEIRAKYGATTVCDSGAGTIAPGASATAEQFILLVNLFGGGTTGTQKGSMQMGASLESGNVGLVTTNFDYGTATEDSTVDKTFTVTVQWSSNSGSLSFVKEVAVCERVNAVVGAQGVAGATGGQGPAGPAIPVLEDFSCEDPIRIAAPTLTVTDIPALPTSKITTGTFDHHSQLTNFTANDDHTQYAFLNGRSGGQTITGDAGAGGNLYLQSTAHATKGNVQLASSTLVFVETSGLASIYANMSTAGVGLATVLGVADPGIQSSGVTNSSIVIPPANGLYKVAVYVEVTTGAGTATVAVSIKYNDDSATAQTLSGFSGLSLTTTGNHNMSVFFVRALTTAAIQYSVTVTGTQGLARYRPFAVVERVA
jgi:hypothetical protein